VQLNESDSRVFKKYSIGKKFNSLMGICKIVNLNFELLKNNIERRVFLGKIF